MINFLNLDINQISRHTFHKNERLLASFKDYTLDTALQPVFSFAHKRIVGYEALVRCHNCNGHGINLQHLFSPDQDESSLIFLDRLCRYIHVRNFTLLNDNINWLFLNVCPQVIMNGVFYGSFFSELLEKFNIPSYRVVIEVIEHPALDQRLLLDTVNFYKKLGCLVAIDDFGSGYSNFERIWSLNPDIIKLDRSMILRASQQKEINQILPGIVSLLHQAGSLVLMEGVETEEQALIAMESDADFVQGYFFAKPSTDFKIIKNVYPPFEELFEKYKRISISQEKSMEKIYHHYSVLYQKAIYAMRGGASLADACSELISDPAVARCYLLLPSGIQIGNTIVSKDYKDKADIRFKPLQDANSADWFRRHYLRNAIIHPEQLQISNPYLSITGANICVTLSMMFSTQGGNRVFCCDVNWK